MNDQLEQSFRKGLQKSAQTEPTITGPEGEQVPAYSDRGKQIRNQKIIESLDGANIPGGSYQGPDMPPAVAADMFRRSGTDPGDVNELLFGAKPAEGSYEDDFNPLQQGILSELGEETVDGAQLLGNLADQGADRFSEGVEGVQKGLSQALDRAEDVDYSQLAQQASDRFGEGIQGARKGLSQLYDQLG